MVTAEHGNSEYVAVWVWLVALLVVGVAIVALPIPKLAAVALVFTVAVVKAAMVVRNYMHLKSEHMLIIAIAMVPVLFFIGLMITLVPDIAMRP
jgi:caa(3)-type oxidase subunit IV